MRKALVPTLASLALCGAATVTLIATNATAQTSAQANARKDIAEADYAIAKAKCDSAAGNEKDVCIKQAKAARVAATAEAKADKKTAEAKMDAKDDKLEANYKVELERCDALAGPTKEACVANVKSKFNKS